ncbi:DNA polymerase III subunit epsilon [Collinsella sp. zg1085]|uniref:helicase C-terminal domain-containing protein n=1 Tax=Collinsella sp. zg1085 TaxID=2844380 RepID=UPI001C0BF3AF|nr:helicase C-terminal domain-containing protein [Collinsella sp. zg1085]QWT17592.1 DNA polymerase III subunit epsilon [Collinsella sp. zg1085]
MNIEAALLPGTPSSICELYASFAEQAKHRQFGVIEDDIVILDTETTGLSFRENELIEISAARLKGREIVERFDTFIHPSTLIPAEITTLTGITNADVAHAPRAEEAVEKLAAFVQGLPVVAHNAAFDRGFIERVKGGTKVSDVWVDSLALSRIALPRLRSHKLSYMAELFECSAVSHRAHDDVDSLAGVWRVLLCALDALPSGLLKRLAEMHSDVAWAYRPIFSYLAGANPGAPFSLLTARHDVLQASSDEDRRDADELEGLSMPSHNQIEACFSEHGLVSRMYDSFEARPEQLRMATEIRDALEQSTHRVIEAGTGVGKSIAYLVPLAAAARKNGVTLGIATKSNNLTDQLIYHELPKLTKALDGDLRFTALKGFDHYPCLRKLEQLERGGDIHTTKDPADTLTAIAVLYSFACQSPTGDLDSLGIRWKSVRRQDLTVTSRECARHLCPFYPDTCMAHGARRRAAQADLVITNHALLFRNVAADGKILPPIRHWVIDEAHAIEAEARRQWATTISSEDAQTLFETLGNDHVGALSALLHRIAGSDAATLYLGLVSRSVATVGRASQAMAELFEALRTLSQQQRTSSNYDTSDVWISAELRGSSAWQDFVLVATSIIHALEAADKALTSVIDAVSAEIPDAAIDISEPSRRLHEMYLGIKVIIDGTDEHFVYSFQVNKRLRAGGESLSAERLDIGSAFAEHWFPEMKSLIFTSATLSIADSFSHFNQGVGLDKLDAAAYKTLQLASSYNYETHMSVIVAGDMPDPRDRDAYLGKLEIMLVDIHQAMGGSVLTLFTNRRDMEELYERVSPQLAAQGLSLDCQRRTSNVKQLRDSFISNASASLFALKAFWEGFDAAGDTLRCVVIPKLPFASPTDPLSCERNIREDRAWMRYALPDAVLEVKQAAGRLIRTAQDTGVLILADSRLITKAYGKKFLRSLPVDYQQIQSENVGKYLSMWLKR